MGRFIHYFNSGVFLFCFFLISVLTLLLGLVSHVPTGGNLVMLPDQHFVGEIAGLEGLMCLHSVTGIVLWCHCILFQKTCLPILSVR